MPRWLSRALEPIGWLALLPMLGLTITLWFGVEGRRTISALQALTPWVLVWAAPLALTATLCRRHALALAALVPLGTLLVMSHPIVFHDDAPAAAATSPRITIAFANVLYDNPTPDDVAARMLATDADVLMLAEFTVPVQQALDRAAGDDYPYRAERVGYGSGSIGMWSRHPIAGGGVVDIGGRPAVDAVLDVEGQQMRVLVVHPYAPTSQPDRWRRQLELIGDLAADGPLPTVIIGDFNAARWHPSFRRLLDRGWRDVHETLGHGWSVSWPMDEGWRPPTFVRIDHALFGDGTTPTSVDDFDVPNSDHKAFVVTFAFTDEGIRAAG
jgi:endonuclease/exonuclease/phosphatase (EEP) superfamily protein YafD